MRVLLALLFSIGLVGCGSVSTSSDADPDESCDPACGSNASCEAASCVCDEGFEGDGQDCVSVATCTVDNGGCDTNADCSGEPGDVTCTCKFGFAGDGETCVEQVNCGTNNGGCAAGADCTGSPGDVTCTCSDGFSGDGFTCADIDECLVDNGGCDDTATCTNTIGDRTCECPPGSFGDGLTCRETWSLVGSLSGLDLSPIGRSAVVAGNSDRIFFSPTTGTTAEQFLRSFNVNTQSFSAALNLPPPGNDYCACGFTEVFLSDGTDMFMLGNDGAKYDVSANSWSVMPGYTGTNRRGEAAGTYDTISDVFLLIGGRNIDITALKMTYTDPTDTYSAEPGTLPISMNNAVAHTMAGTTRTYVAGGDDNSGVGLLTHLTGTSTWTRLADAPSGLGRPLGMGQFGALVWVARSSGSYAFYDPAMDAWTAHNIMAPAGALGVATVSGSSYVISQATASSDILIHRLNAIE